MMRNDILPRTSLLPVSRHSCRVEITFRVHAVLARLLAITHRLMYDAYAGGR
jgi:hypothetical protein